MPDPKPRQSLRCRLKAKAWGVLASFRSALARPMTVRAADDVHRVVLTVLPASSAEEAPGESFPGLHFSPFEAAVYHSLAAGPLSGKKLARAVGQPYGPKLRTLLHNLLERHVLTHDAAGYSRRKAGGETARPAAG